VYVSSALTRYWYVHVACSVCCIILRRSSKVAAGASAAVHGRLLLPQRLHGGGSTQPLNDYDNDDDLQPEDYLPEDAVAFAHRVGRVGREPQVTAARMVIRAAAPWSPETHSMWPAAARAHVCFLLLLCARVNPEAREVWVARVLPRVVRRSGIVSHHEMEEEGIYEGSSECYREHFPYRYHEPLVL
jgi:hypothetical protein